MGKSICTLVPAWGWYPSKGVLSPAQSKPRLTMLYLVGALRATEKMGLCTWVLARKRIQRQDSKLESENSLNKQRKGHSPRNFEWASQRALGCGPGLLLAPGQLGAGGCGSCFLLKADLSWPIGSSAVQVWKLDGAFLQPPHSSLRVGFYHTT